MLKKILGFSLFRNFLDVLLIPITFIAALWSAYFRRSWGANMPITKFIFNTIGVFPIVDHYYEPLFNLKHISKSLREDRNLPGINLNLTEQLELLNSFDCNQELLSIPNKRLNDTEFYFNNGSFESGDAEYLYNMIRTYKPSQILEIGSGNSTLMAKKAVDKNKELNPTYNCEHICIEPFEMPWLENLNVNVVREKVEDLDKSVFKNLKANDILFIDSSHVIRPQGDVLCEYLEILPILNSGVIVHIHDIFTPKDYLNEWVLEHNRFWNEQYLLEAFLSMNNHYRIIGALNYLKHNHWQLLSSKCPYLLPEREPGSFWMIKN